MTRKVDPGGLHRDWGDYPSTRFLPNQDDTRSVQTNELEVGDLAHVGPVEYVCTVATRGAATWLEKPSASGLAALEAQFAPPRWDDLRFPASGINLPGSANQPGRDDETGLLLFDDNRQEVVAFQVQLPHAWARTPINPHVHWIQRAAGTVLWRFEYQWLPTGVPVATVPDWTVVESSTPIFAYTGDVLSQVTSFGDIALDPTAGDSDMLICRLSRMGGTAPDDYSGDVQLLEVDIHIQVDSLGSVGQFGDE
jgi:hypothetical protein